MSLSLCNRLQWGVALVGRFAILTLFSVASIAASGQTVNVWLTTDSQTTKLGQQSPVSFNTGVGTGNPVYVDQTQTYQNIEGFGACSCDSSAYLLYEVAPLASRNIAMQDLFTRSGSGIGLNFIRNPMGASDLARYPYTFDDMPSGQTDPNLANFSIAHDQVDIIPMILQARQLNPGVEVMANPWSPPAWMKNPPSGSTTPTLNGGTLNSTYNTPFTNYFIKYLQAYQAAGIPVNYISLQNEPLYDTSTNPNPYPGMLMDAPTQANLLANYFLPALTANGLTTKVLVYDHNFDQPGYPETVLSTGTLGSSAQIAGIAWHGYGGTPGAMWTLHTLYPNMGDYHTELSGGTWVKDQVKADFENITQVMRNWGRTFVKWPIALDQNHSPHDGGCGICNPLVTVDSGTGAITYEIEYYTLGQYSKFVLPGASRTWSSNANGIISVSFVNPDGSNVLVAYNETRAPNTFQVNWGGHTFSYKLPGLSGATFVWSGTQSGSYTLNAKTQIQASSLNNAFGLETETTSDSSGGYDVGYAGGGDWAVYNNVDFGTGVSSVSVRVASAGNGGTLAFHLDSPTGALIGSVTVPVTGGWQTWTTVTGAVTGATGVHNLYAVFQGTNPIGNFNWFQFK